MAVPVRVTVSPSVTAWSAPAWTAGRAFTWAMVISTWSEAVALWSSVAVKVKVMVVLAGTCGAVNVVDMEVALSSCMSRVESCDHR